MTISTYALLQTTLAGWLNRSDLTLVIPTFIELAEASFRRREEFQEEFRGTIALSGSAVALPDDCREVTSLYLDTSAFRGPIEVSSPENVAIRKGLYGATGIPQLAAVSSNGTELLLAPEADTTYIATMVYLLKLTALSDAAPSNWLLADHPDLYLWGALVESAPYLKDDARIAVWQNKLDRAAAEMAAMMERRRFSPNTAVLRPRQAIG